MPPAEVAVPTLASVPATITHEIAFTLDLVIVDWLNGGRKSGSR